MSEPVLPVASTATTLMRALSAHYRKPGVSGGDGEVLLPEVQAPGSGRRCDLLRIGLWPSRGLGIDVHELKVSRSDWLRELDDPGKADAWWEYSSRFWIVAPPRMIRPEEMPRGWGLMVPPTQAGRRKFQVVVKPETRAPKLTVQLLAALVTRAESLHAEHIHRLQVDHRNDVDRAIRVERQRRSEVSFDPRTRERLELLDRLESQLGVTLAAFPWRDGETRPAELGTALKDYVHEHVALQRRREEIATQQGRLRRAAEKVLGHLEEVAANA
jgi:hypothetical protein